MTDKIYPAWNVSTGAVSHSVVTDSPSLSVEHCDPDHAPSPTDSFHKKIRNLRLFLVFSCRRM